MKPISKEKISFVFRLVAMIVLTLLVCAFCVNTILMSYYYVEDLEFVDADFEWVDDFQNYEVKVYYNDDPLYLTVADDKIKFIFAGEDFLNFVVVDHSKRVVDGQDSFSVRLFYINLCYKETE